MDFTDHGVFTRAEVVDSMFGRNVAHFRAGSVDFYDIVFISAPPDIDQNGRPKALTVDKLSPAPLAGFLVDAETGEVRGAAARADQLAPDGFRVVTTPASPEAEALVGVVGFRTHEWDGSNIVATTPAAPIAIASRVQIELWLNANGFPGGFENESVIAAANSAGEEARIRLRSGQRFRSDDPFLAAAAPALGIPDLYAAVVAAAQL